MSNIAKGPLKITAEALFDCSTVIGQVFNDLNGNGYQDKGEEGLPAQRIIALVDGTAKTIRTDQYGRYHVPCASLPDQYIGSNILLKLDERRAPSGFRVTSENPRTVRLTAGKMSKVNFGVQIDRVVNLSLNACAFVGNTLELTDHPQDGMRALIKTLEAGRSTLRLTYRQRDEGDALAKRRSKGLEKLIKKLWKNADDNSYTLDVENTLVKAIGQGPLNCDAPAYVAPEPVKKPVPQQQVEVRSEVKAQVQSGAIVQSHGLVQSQVVQQGYVTVPRPPIVQQRYVLQGYVTPGQLQQGYATGQLRPGTGTETLVNGEYVKGGVLTGSTVNGSYVNGGYVNGGMVPGTLNQTVTTPPRSW